MKFDPSLVKIKAPLIGLALLLTPGLSFGSQTAFLDSGPMVECSKGLVIVANAYLSVSRDIAQRLKSSGYTIAHLATEPQPAGGKYFREEDYDLSLTYNGNFDDTLSQLVDLDPIGFFPGGDLGVAWADRFSHGLGLIGNSPDGSLNRTEKFQMIKVLRDAGLATAEQFESNSEDAIVRWAQKFLPGKEVIVKPPMGSGNDRVFICRNEADVRKAVAKITRPTEEGYRRFETAVVQTRLIGPEFIVEHASSNGRHFPLSVWRYFKGEIAGMGTINNAAELLDPENPEDRKIIDILLPYASAALDVSGMENGISHMEVILDQTVGPAMVEINARPGGAGIPVLFEAATGVSEIEMMIDIYLKPENFDSLSMELPKLQNQTRTVLVGARKNGIASHRTESELARLPSFKGVVWFYEDGAPVKKTDSIRKMLGYIKLVHPDRVQIEKDMAAIRDLEDRGLFTQD